MMDDDKLQTAINRGVQADAKLKDPFLNECFDAIKAALVDGWAESSLHMSSEREHLWQLYQATAMLKALLVKYVNDGKMARVDLERLLNLKR